MPTSKTAKKHFHMSRALIVGLCAVVTILLCASVGVALLCRHTMRQRKLHMEFEDDVHLKALRKKEGRSKKEGKWKEEGSPEPPDLPPIYSPPSKQFSYPGHGHPGNGHPSHRDLSKVHSPPRRLFSKPSHRYRPRLGACGGDSSTTVLIDIDEESELEIITNDCYGGGKKGVAEPLLSLRSTCEVTAAHSANHSSEDQSSTHCNLEHSCMTSEQNSEYHVVKAICKILLINSKYSFYATLFRYILPKTGLTDVKLSR